MPRLTTRIYLDESFYIVPQHNVAQEAFAVIRDAMSRAGARRGVSPERHIQHCISSGKGNGRHKSRAAPNHNRRPRNHHA